MTRTYNTFGHHFEKTWRIDTPFGPPPQLTMRKVCKLQISGRNFGLTIRTLFPIAPVSTAKISTDKTRTMLLIFDIAKHANEKGITTLADIPAPLNSTVDTGELSNWYNSAIPSPGRYSTLTKSTLGLQSMAIFNGNLTLLTSFGTDYIETVNDEVTTFSVGNNWHTTAPYYAPKAEVYKFVVSILPQGLADDTDFTQLNVNLVDVAASTEADMPVGGLERFNLPNYDPNDATTHPTLVYLPVLGKLGYGHKLPATVNITSFDTDAETFTKGGNYEGWILAMKWSVENNNGASLHYASRFFNNNDIQPTAEMVQNLADRCDFHHAAVQLPNDGTGGYDAVTTRVQDAIVLAAQKGGIQVSDRHPSTPDRVINTTTQTEQRTNDKNEQRMRKLRLLLVGKDDAGNAVIPELAPYVIEAYSETTPVKSAVVLRAAFRDYRLGHVKKILGSRGGNFTLTPEQWYPLFTKTVLDVSWFAENLAYAPDMILKEITIFAMLKANVNTSTFNEIIVYGQKLMNDVEMAPSSNNHVSGSANLYTRGQCTKVADGLSALANTEGLLSFLLAKPHKHTPCLNNFLKGAYERLDNMETKATLEGMCDGPSPNKFFIPNYLKDVSAGVAHVANFAHSYDARMAMESNKPIDEFLAPTIRNINTCDANMNLMMATGKFGDMMAMPSIYTHISSVPAVHERTDNNSNNNGGRANGNNRTPGSPEDLRTPNAKKQKKQNSPTSVAGGSNPSTRPPNSTRGIIKNVDGHSGLPRIPPGIKAKMPNRENALGNLCNKHIMDGVSCAQTNCRYAHVNNHNFHNRIPDVEHQKLFCDYVNNAAGFTWAHGVLEPKSQ